MLFAPLRDDIRQSNCLQVSFHSTCGNAQLVFYRGLIFRLKTTQFAFSTAHRTKTLYLAITLLVTQVRCQSQHLTNTALHRTTPHYRFFALFYIICQDIALFVYYSSKSRAFASNNASAVLCGVCEVFSQHHTASNMLLYRTLRCLLCGVRQKTQSMFLQRKNFLLQLLFEKFRISHPRCSGIYTPMFKKVPRQGTKVPSPRALLCPSEELSSDGQR